MFFAYLLTTAALHTGSHQPLVPGVVFLWYSRSRFLTNTLIYYESHLQDAQMHRSHAHPNCTGIACSKAPEDTKFKVCTLHVPKPSSTEAQANSKTQNSDQSR